MSDINGTRKDIDHRMARAVEVLLEEFGGLRTGRAAASLSGCELHSNGGANGAAAGASGAAEAALGTSGGSRGGPPGC